MSELLLEVKNLSVHYPVKQGFLKADKIFKAVDDISFTIKKGQTVGLVGESGSGKTTTGRALVKLAPITKGQILYAGEAITNLSLKRFLPYRRKIQMIFQDPYASLNPRMTVQEIIAEPLKVHFPHMKRKDRVERVSELLDKVGLSPKWRSRYPHQFSGGQRQRINIARALACEPEFIICDEPVSALDVSVQAQIVNLLQDLQEAHELTYLFIAYDLAVVEHISDFVLVMTEGKIVEQAEAEAIYKHAEHPYTQKLLSAVPVF